MFNQFDQCARAPFWMQKNHSGSGTTGPGFGIQKLSTDGLKACNLRLEVIDPQRNVMQSRSAPLKKARNR